MDFHSWCTVTDVKDRSKDDQNGDKLRTPWDSQEQHIIM